MRVTVGEDCNSWMGRTFESPTKPVLVPLIDGVPHSLLPAGLALVARWATKTALVTAAGRRCGHRRGLPGVASERRRPAAGNPGPHWSLPFAGEGTGRHPSTCRGRIDATFLGYPNIVGRLVFVVYIPLRGRPVRTVAEAQGTLVPIWPPTGTPITWPLPAGLDAEQVEDAFAWQPA